MSLSAAARPDESMTVLRYLDVVLLLIAAPILLLIGVPALGYGVGTGAWLILRVVGVAVDRYAGVTRLTNKTVTVRLAFILSRLFLLALAVILVRRSSGKDDGLTALLVIIVAFTVELLVSFANRPRSR